MSSIYPSQTQFNVLKFIFFILFSHLIDQYFIFLYISIYFGPNKYFIIFHFTFFPFYQVQNLPTLQKNHMKSHFKTIDPNVKHLSRTSVQSPSDMFPNLNKSLKIPDSVKGSFQPLNTSVFKDKIQQRPAFLPQINQKEKQNSQQIRKLLKQKSVPLRVVPMDKNSKTKFGWSVSGSPHHKEHTHKKQNSLTNSVPSVQQSPYISKNNIYRLSILNLKENLDQGSQTQQLRNSPSTKLSKFGQTSSVSGGSYQNFTWNQVTQQIQFVEDQIVSEGFDKKDMKTLKFMEADREIEMRKNEIVSIGRDLEKKENEGGQNRISELVQNQSNKVLENADQNESKNQNEQKKLSTKREHSPQQQTKAKLPTQHHLTKTERTVQDQNKSPRLIQKLQNPPSQIAIKLPSEQQVPLSNNRSKESAKTIVNIKSTRIKKQNLKELKPQDKQKSHWLQTMEEIYAEFNKMGYDRAIFQKQIFLHIVSTFSKFYMDKQEKMYFLDIIHKLVLVNSGWEKVDDQLKFSGQMGVKLQKLANTIHFKHKECLQNWQFIGSYDKTLQAQGQSKQKKPEDIAFTELNFNMDHNQIAILAKRVEKLCVNNMDAFAFISLYFQISIDIILKEKTFKETQKQFIKCLEFLDKLYPANRAQVIETQKTKQVNGENNVKDEKSAQQKRKNAQSFGIETIKIDHQFDWVIFDKKSTLSKFDQLKDYIKNIAKLAEKDLQIYIDLVKYSCIEHGFGFKSDLKIKNNDSQVFSIMRTIEKLLTSSFGKELENLKHERMERADDQLKYGSIKNFIEKEQQEVQNDIKNILEKQDRIMFKAKDLVRGKCKFNTIEEIQATIKLLKANIEKNADKGIKIIELENRLGNNTKDVVLLIKLPHTVAELQLALKLDSVLNEFNHKIYQLRRSKIYACVSNLFIRGKKWAEAFFRQQLQLFKQMSLVNPKQKYGEPVCAEEIKKYVLLFEENELKENDIKASSDKLQAYNEHRQIDDKVTMIEKGIKRGYHSLLEKKKRVDMQKENAVLFYLKNGRVTRAWQIVESFSEEQLDKNPIILRLKGDILREREEKGDQKKCIECYERYVSLQMDENGQTIEMANVLLMLAEIKLGNRNFKQAEIYFKRCARIRERIFKKQSTEYAMVLNRMGHLYRIQGKHEFSMRFYKRALQIIVMKSGKDSIAAAEVYCSLGNACFCCGQVSESHDFYQKSLQIYKKVKGSKSIQVSIIYNNMGNFYKQQLKFSEALEKYQKCLQIKEKLKGQTSLDVAYVYNNIGTLYRKFENFIEAEKFYKMSLMIKKKAKGQMSYHAAVSYVDMGKFYTAKSVSKDKHQEDYDIAMDYFKQALKIKKQVFKGQQNLEIADIISSMGSLKWTRKDPKALQYYTFSLDIMDKIKAGNTIEYSKVLINMGMVYQESAREHKEKGDYKKAEKDQFEAVKKYDRGATIEQNIRGETADLAQTNYSLSQLYLQMEMYQRAYECADKAFLIWKKVRGDDYKYTKNAFVLRDKILALKNAHKR